MAEPSDELRLLREQVAVLQAAGVQHQREEAALHTSEARLANVIAAAPDTMIVLDAEHKIVVFNAAAERMFACTSTEVVGQPIDRFMTLPRDIIAANSFDFAGDSKAGHSSAILHEPIAARRANGDEFPIEATISHTLSGEDEYVTLILRDITKRLRAETILHTRAYQLAVIAELSQRALAGSNVSLLTDEATELLAQTLDVEYSAVLELLPDGTQLAVRAGVGWNDGVVGQATIETGSASQFGYALLLGEPIVVEDHQGETRFHIAALLTAHGVVSSMTVTIHGQQRPFGILTVHSRRKRYFSNDDQHFLQTVANVLGTAIERKHMEDIRSFYRAIVTSSEDAIIGAGVDATIVSWNPGAERLFGYKAEEMIGHPLTILSPPGQKTEALRRFETAVSGNVEHFETEQVCKDGHLVHISITFSPTREPFGEVTGVSAILHDISERIQSAASIRRSRDELEAILRNVADGIAVQDATGRLVFANTAAARIAGYESVAEMLEDDRYGLFQRFTILDENGALVSSENLPGARALRDEADAEALLCFRTSATGEERWAKVRATVILEQQHVRLVINVFHDVTEERHAQEERAAANVLREMDRLKSEFIAHISHELRTPLHHVKGYAMTLLRHGPRLSPQDTQEALTIISDESDQLARLIDDLLNSSQIENGTLHLSFDTVYLDELVRSAIHRWQNVEGYTFKAICPAKVPPIPADRQRIQQVLDNLLTNVVRHTPLNTSTTVSIEVNRDHVVVSVSDQGPGVPEEHLPFLFDRFYQFPNSSGARRGSGLGLFISKGIIEQHGGRIWFEVSKGPGTTVRFRLPRRRMAALPT